MCREQSFGWNGQFWFLLCCKSFVSLIVNIFNAQLFHQNWQICLLLTFAPYFSFSCLAHQNIFKLILELSNIFFWIFLKLLRDEMDKREQVSDVGVSYLGRDHKKSFMAFLLPVEGNFTCSRGEKGIRPHLPFCSYFSGPPAVNYWRTLFKSWKIAD